MPVWRLSLSETAVAYTAYELLLILANRPDEGLLFDREKAMISRSKEFTSAECYDLTRDKLDFIINYDIKYRMGQDESNDA